MNRKIKFAVVGCGHIGKRHMRLISENKECELVAICDVKPFEKLNIGKPNVPFYNNLSELLKAENLDVVNICTPNGLHAQQCLEVLTAKKHVVCEKPMGLTKRECEAVIFKALNVSKQVFVVMQNRYSPPILWLKKIIDENKLGKIFIVEINCYWNRDNRYYLPDGKRHDWHGTVALDGGALFTQFSHFTDIMYWIFGDIKNIQSRFKNFAHKDLTEFDDSGIVQFEFEQGGMGCLTFSTAVWDKNMESSITVLGQNGSVKIGGQYMNELTYCHIKDVEVPVFDGKIPQNNYEGYQGSADNHKYVIQNVVDVCKGKKEAATNALEGIKVVEITERIYKANN